MYIVRLVLAICLVLAACVGYAAEPVYQLPYPPGDEFMVGQADHEFPTHEEIFAVDWIMPEGTPIHAARAGVVEKIVDHFTDHGLTEEMKAKSNHVVVRHDDGSVAVYHHLAARGVKVRRGQKVAAGEVLALSGNTGFSAVPHLHFEVGHRRNGRYETLPTPFRLENGDVGTMVHGAIYRAPGGKPKVETGPLAGVAGTGDLTHIYGEIVALAERDRDHVRAAAAVKRHLEANIVRYQSVYRAVFARAQRGDKTAMRELQNFQEHNLHSEPAMAALLADPASEAVAYEAMGIWWQQMSPVAP